MIKVGSTGPVFYRQERIGYRSELIVGEAEVDAHMKRLFPDWRAKGVTTCLHEHQGGFAFNTDSVMGLRDKCIAEGVAVLSYTEVTGLRFRDDDSVSVVETIKGPIEVGEQVVIAPGPWARQFWSMLGLPDAIEIQTPSGDVVRTQDLNPYNHDKSAGALLRYHVSEENHWVMKGEDSRFFYQEIHAWLRRDLSPGDPNNR